MNLSFERSYFLETSERIQGLAKSNRGPLNTQCSNEIVIEFTQKMCKQLLFCRSVLVQSTHQTNDVRILTTLEKSDNGSTLILIIVFVYVKDILQSLHQTVPKVSIVSSSPNKFEETSRQRSFGSLSYGRHSFDTTPSTFNCVGVHSLVCHKLF